MNDSKIKLSVSCTANDHAEAEAAGIAALTEEARGNSKGERPGDLRLGDLITIVLCLFILIGGGYLVVQTPHDTHAISRPNMDLIQTLVIASALPLYVISTQALELSRSGAQRLGVPFYATKRPYIGPPSWLPRLVTGVGFTLLIVAAFVLTRPTNANWKPTFGGLFAVLAAPWLVCLFALYFIFGWGRFRHLRRRELENMFATEGTTLNDTNFIEIGADGMVCGDSLVSTHMAWAYFVSHLESANLLLLYTRNLTVRIIPKRAFSDPAELEQFCNLVQEKIPAGRLLPKPVIA